MTKNFYDGSVSAEFNQPDDINDVSHTSTYARAEEAIRKDERSTVQLLGRAITLLETARSIYPEGSSGDDGWGLAKQAFLEELNR